MTLIYFSLPGSTVVQKYFANQHSKKTQMEVIATQKQGFIFAPFQSKLVDFYTDLEKINDNNIYQQFYFLELNHPLANEETSQKEFLLAVQKSLELIEQKKINKICLSRRFFIKKKNFKLMIFFEKLVRNYKSSFVYLISNEKLGTWIGASPELLLGYDDKKKKVSTVSLAGTKSLQEEKTYNNNWDDKNIQEQSFVTDYIISIFKKLHFQNIKISSINQFTQGLISHIKTDICATVEDSSKSIPLLLEHLHPTPAVCGYPKAASIEKIILLEKYPRSYYTGYLGPVNFCQKTDLFVNIRCMQSLITHHLLYAGVGIVKGSQPQKEWEETEMKLNILKSHLCK